MSASERVRSLRLAAGAVLGVILCWAHSALPASNPYQLEPKRIADDTYVLLGKRAELDFDNNGNVVNTGFIVTEDGVVVIDTGPSRLYGEAQRAAIAQVTEQPVVQVYISHAHPDHFLGSNAFEDVPVGALAGTAAAVRRSGSELAAHLYDRVGGAMRGTAAVVPTRIVEPGERVRFGTHPLELIGAAGHSPADLMILDHATGVLFAGDIAFYQRAAATPGADVAVWRKVLAATMKRSFKILVPGHGPVAHNDAPLRQTDAYLDFLMTRFRQAAAQGHSAAEVMFRPLPPCWQALAVEPAEYRRSVSRLYPAIERAALENVDTASTD